MGHEFSGMVGSRRVAVNPMISCGECEYCTTGRSHLCRNRVIIGIQRAGGLAPQPNNANPDGIPTPTPPQPTQGVPAAPGGFKAAPTQCLPGWQQVQLTHDAFGHLQYMTCQSPIIECPDPGSGYTVGLEVAKQNVNADDGRFRIQFNWRHPAVRRILILYAPIVVGLLARPDLQVQAITAPDRALAGSSFSVEFTVINHYLLGEDYPAFDLLHWNGDVTNLPAKWHEAYLRDCYRDNLLVKPDGRKSWIPTMQHIALEGRCFVLSACQHLTRGECPPDYAAIQGDDPATVLMRGGSCIVSPSIAKAQPAS